MVIVVMVYANILVLQQTYSYPVYFLYKMLSISFDQCPYYRILLLIGELVVKLKKSIFKIIDAGNHRLF